MNWFFDLLGITHTSNSRWYTFWTGFVRDVPLIAAAYVFGRRHNCHMKRCFRIGRIPLAGSEYTLCHRHHPGGDTSQQVMGDAIDRRNSVMQIATAPPVIPADAAAADVAVADTAAAIPDVPAFDMPTPEMGLADGPTADTI